MSVSALADLGLVYSRMNSRMMTTRCRVLPRARSVHAEEAPTRKIAVGRTASTGAIVVLQHIRTQLIHKMYLKKICICVRKYGRREDNFVGNRVHIEFGQYSVCNKS